MKNPHHPKLIFVGEPFDGRVFELESEKTNVGRSSQNHLCIQDASVSAKHCEILANAAEIIVRDLNSSNGTFVNAVRVASQAQLKHGQILRIGNVNARLELAGADSDGSSSDITAVHLHAKFMRDARREEAPREKATQHVTLEGGANKQPVEHTVTLEGTSDRTASGHAPAAVLPENIDIPRRGSGAGKLVFAGVLILLVAVAWWVLRK